LGFPLFVKPPNGGGGRASADSVVRDFAAFEKQSRAHRADLQQLAPWWKPTCPAGNSGVALLQALDMTEPDGHANRTYY